jgi:hypothetical protein
VKNALQGADQIVLFGTGTGLSNEMDQFMGWLKAHHPECSERIVETLTVDEHHLTANQLLAKARNIYALASMVEA